MINLEPLSYPLSLLAVGVAIALVFYVATRAPVPGRSQQKNDDPEDGSAWFSTGWLLCQRAHEKYWRANSFLGACYISLAEAFGNAPGGDTREDGPYSGQAFREDVLESHFTDPAWGYLVVIDMDGPEGFTTGFLAEAFCGLAERYGADRVRRRLWFVTQEFPDLPGRIFDLLDKMEKEQPCEP